MYVKFSRPKSRHFQRKAQNCERAQKDLGSFTVTEV